MSYCNPEILVSYCNPGNFSELIKFINFRLWRFIIMKSKQLIFITGNVSLYTLGLEKLISKLFIHKFKSLRTIRKLIAYKNFQDYSMLKWRQGKYCFSPIK